MATPKRGKSMSSAAGSRAKTSRSPARGPASPKAPAPACGRITFGSFAFYDRDTSSWRTCQPSLFGGWDEFSETWPRAGLMSRGIACLRVPLVPLTAVTGCFSLPTPQKFDGVRCRMNYETMDSSRRHAKGGCSNLTETLGGMPNPVFVEWMMGFPPNWTVPDSEASETPLFRKSPSGSADA